jgi:prepilin signal peptidase PulO-like enzyme (type II secretory pathway)
MTMSDFQQNIPHALAALALGLLLGRFVMPHLVELAIRSSYSTSEDNPDYDFADNQGLACHTPARKFMLVASAICPALITLLVGPTHMGFSLSVYLLTVILLTAINLEHLLLPDSIVLTSLWTGLLYHSTIGSANEFVFGAALAYIFPFLFYAGMRRLTGRESLGLGDLKCFSMTGAWLGYGALATLFLAFFTTAVLLGIRVAIKQPGNFIPTGIPHFIAAALTVTSVILAAP